MTQRCIGIDTSILVRLVTGDPPDAYAYCVGTVARASSSGAEVYASNQVIGEAFMAVRHHYGVTSADACAELSNTLKSGLVTPLNGSAVLEALASTGGPGLFDRLISNDYQRSGLETLTLDRQMASLSGAQLL